MFRKFQKTPCSVQELNQYIAEKFEQDENLCSVQVSGEISGLKIYAGSGHAYFTLKDSEASISCVMFSNWLRRLRFRPEDGMQVWILGSVHVYSKQGRYQLYAEDMQPAGIGNYYARLEAVKQRLQSEGIFDPAHKRPLPFRASRIGIITSLQGAALRDMVRILRLRQPGVTIIAAHSLVQGAEAPASLVQALEKMNRFRDVDVILFGRGGGSREDLMAFDDESVVRAVYASRIPVIAAIGHEVDVSLCDLAADVRAATPTQAAQLAVPEDEALWNVIVSLRERLEKAMRRRLEQAAQTLDDTVEELQQTQHTLLQQRGQQLAQLQQELQRQMKLVMEEKNHILQKQLLHLEALNPMRVLRRGYSCLFKESSPLLRASDAAIGDRLRVKMQDGSLLVQVMERELYEETEI